MKKVLLVLCLLVLLTGCGSKKEEPSIEKPKEETPIVKDKKKTN